MKNQCNRLQGSLLLWAFAIAGAGVIASLSAASSFAQEYKTKTISIQRSEIKRGEALNELNQLAGQASQLARQQKHEEAASLWRKAVEAAERLLGQDHPTVARYINSLATLYETQGLYVEAEKLFAKALLMQQKNLGNDHLEVASTLNNLANVYHARGDYQKAEPLYTRALKIEENALGHNHPDSATLLSNLASLYDSSGNYPEAERLHLRVIAITQNSLDPGNPLRATYLNNFASLYASQGLYDKAEPLLSQALSIRKDAYGHDHVEVAEILDNLASVYHSQGHYRKAEAYFVEALEIKKKTIGFNHPSVAHTLDELAFLYIRQGMHSKAEPLLIKAIEIRNKSLAPDSIKIAISLDRLATLYYTMGLYAKAEPLSSMAVLIALKSLGINHVLSLSYLSNLALLYQDQGRYDEAEPIYNQVLSISQEILRDKHPQLVPILNNISTLYILQGRHEKAGPLLKQALDITQNALGLNHPRTVVQISNLATSYAIQDLHGRAEPIFRQGLRTQSTLLQREAFYLPKSERAAYVQSLGNTNEAVFSFTHKSPASANLALFSRLNRHGLLEQIEKRQAQLAALPGAQQEVAQELRSLTQRLSSTTLPAEQRTVLRARQEELERQLYRLLPELKPTVVEVEQVAAVMPSGSALVEFQRYQPFDGRQPPRQRWGQPRYLALILKPDRSVRSVDLGAAAPIDQLIQQALKASEQNQQDATSLWAQVSRAILTPLATETSGVQALFLSPDGELNRVPFAALSVDGSGRLLAEIVQLRLLTTGRDLLDLQQPAPAPRSAALVVANPSFDRQSRAIGSDKPSRKSTLISQQRSADLDNLRWKPLPATAAEGQAIASLTQGKLLVQEQATAAAVQQQNGPRVLHIASHAFFLPHQPPRTDTATSERALMLASDRSLPISGQMEENPLLRSGIALAGANTAPATAADDGYLMALEVAQLDWKGTELVVVSACESGKGEIRAGEGVYGLRRAIAVAGARSSLLSLWKVDDAATAEFMTRYYTRLKAGQGRADALAAVQSEFRKGTAGNGQWKEPYHWAAWQLVGDWGPIRGL